MKLAEAYSEYQSIRDKMARITDQLTYTAVSSRGITEDKILTVTGINSLTELAKRFTYLKSMIQFSNNVYEVFVFNCNMSIAVALANRNSRFFLIQAIETLKENTKQSVTLDGYFLNKTLADLYEELRQLDLVIHEADWKYDLITEMNSKSLITE